jgi:hypothetical protein
MLVKSVLGALRHGTGLLEILVVVGIATVGVIIAALVALAPWSLPDAGVPLVVHFVPPAPHG